MRKNSLIILVLLMSFTQLAFSGTRDSGKNLMLLGSSTAALGRAGTGVAGYGSDYFAINPATAAEAERIAASLDYGTLAGGFSDASVSLLYPTSYGVFLGSYRRLSVSDSSDLEKAQLFTLGAGKEFTSKLSLGLSFNLLIGSAASSANYGGLTLGILYHTKYEKEIGKGFGIFNPRLGLSVNAGIPFGTSHSDANLNQPTAGIYTGFYRNSIFTIGLFNDYSMIHGYGDFAAKAGIESVIKEKYIIRLGGSYPQNYEYGDFTFGAGYRLNARTFSADFNYALVHYEKSSFTHYLGVTAEFGELDRTPPATQVKTNELYISPNNDGTQDYVNIALNVQDRSKIKGWQLQILDAQGSVVKEYKYPNRDMEPSLTVKEFFRRIIAKKESAVVPENILWDGTNASGSNTPDGEYKYAFMAYDERDNYSDRTTGSINVDRTSPAAQLSVTDTLFSPNGDGKKDELVIQQKITTSPDDQWTASIKNSSGKEVKSFSWKGSEVPPMLKWDGKDTSGAEVPEGLYSYTVASMDKAGNKTNEVLSQISLTRKFETADISILKDYFSFKKDKSMFFKPVLSSREGLVSWEIRITDEDDNPVRIIKETGELPDKVDWDVTDEKQKPLDDGKYFYALKGVYRSGNEPASFKKTLIVDSTPPDLDLGFTPGLFSPDGDGQDDVLTFEPEGKDEFGISDWRLTVTSPTGILFKTFTGKDAVPSEIKWEGISDSNELVESATDYSVSLSAVDRAGNEFTTPQMVLPVDVLVIVTERGLKIRISNIEFAFDSAKIVGNGFRILNRVAQILGKYDKYRILVEGHTDDIGDENYNLRLSEQRAQTVLDYLVSKGVPRERLKARGMGETTPFVLNKDAESRRKNRRVEFLLEKIDKTNPQPSLP